LNFSQLPVHTFSNPASSTFHGHLSEESVTRGMHVQHCKDRSFPQDRSR
jgi:hypothetical protein